MDRQIRESQHLNLGRLIYCFSFYDKSKVDMDRNEKKFVKEDIKRYVSDPLGEKEGNKIIFLVEFFSRPDCLLEMFHVQ